VISVERSRDQKEGLVEPKSAAGCRRVPIAAVLRDYLVCHLFGRPEAQLRFGRRDEILSARRRSPSGRNVPGTNMAYGP